MIVNAHEGVAGGTWQKGDQLVAADAKTAVSQMAHVVRRQLQAIMACVEDDKIVAQSVHLHERSACGVVHCAHSRALYGAFQPVVYVKYGDLVKIT